MSQACALSASAQAARTVVRASTAQVARAPFFTGARLHAAAPRPAAASRREAVRTMALFGGGAATAGKSVYDYTVKVGTCPSCIWGGCQGMAAWTLGDSSSP